MIPRPSITVPPVFGAANFVIENKPFTPAVFWLLSSPRNVAGAVLLRAYIQMSTSHLTFEKKKLNLSNVQQMFF